ncbi:MAG TPA: hypothetical protein VF660_00405 [Actinomycetota bacterium]
MPKRVRHANLKFALLLAGVFVSAAFFASPSSGSSIPCGIGPSPGPVISIATQEIPCPIDRPLVTDLNGTEVKIGDVIARLSRSENGCDGEAGVEVISGPEPTGVDADVLLQVDADCRVIVKAIVEHPADYSDAEPPPADSVSPTEAP